MQCGPIIQTRDNTEKRFVKIFGPCWTGLLVSYRLDLVSFTSPLGNNIDSGLAVCSLWTQRKSFSFQDFSKTLLHFRILYDSKAYRSLQ